jgi:competence protein ComEC
MNEPLTAKIPLVRIWFVDVGQGDCTLVVDTQTRRALLIDCPSWHVERVRDLLRKENASLDTVIVTHWDLDHYGGAARLAVDYAAARVYYNHETLFAADSRQSVLIRTTLKHFRNIPHPDEVLNNAEAGQKGSSGHFSWEVLAPTHAELTAAYSEGRRNVASAVVDIRVPGLRILIGGDAVGASWRRLLGERDLVSNVLRWPHHGAELAGDNDGNLREAVLTAVNPDIVVISAGTRNRYGHPAHLVVRGAVSHGASVLCTQVTSGCFGYLSRDERNSDDGQSVVSQVSSSHCAGTIAVECWADTYTVVPSQANHSERVLSWPQPLCAVHKGP